jgi:phage baseplate assembly protein W
MTEEIFGFSSPFRIDPNTGGVAAAGGAEKLKENIIHILLTGTGERVMHRDYGAGLRQLVHDPGNEALRAILQHQIAKAVGRWEPRVAVEQVRVALDGPTLVAEIVYAVRRTRQRQSLSVPIGLGGI